MDPAQMMERTLERSEPGIALIGVIAIGQVQDVRRTDRRVLDLARPSATEPLVTLECSSERA
jgi:hypothetical protein